MFFEVHITVKQLTELQKLQFLDFCNACQSKAIFIELACGNSIDQPMLTKAFNVDNLQYAQKLAQNLLIQLKHAKFEPIRLKIEVPSDDFAIMNVAMLDTIDLHQIKKYFEWHGKISFINVEQLKKLCKQQDVHLSRNALKNQQDYRFITIREFGDKDKFELRIFKLKYALSQGGWFLQKEQSEYCIYDSNLQLDNGWLTHEYPAS